MPLTKRLSRDGMGSFPPSQTTVLGSVTMTVSINTRTWVDASEVISSKTVNKDSDRPHVASD